MADQLIEDLRNTDNLIEQIRLSGEIMDEISKMPLLEAVRAIKKASEAWSEFHRSTKFVHWMMADFEARFRALTGLD
jgi:hypothetical protein